MRKHMSLTISLLIVVLVGAAISRPNQSSHNASEVLGRRVRVSELGDFPPVTALAVALNDAKVPGGIVKIAGCEEQPRKKLTSTSSTLQGVLEAFVSADSRYKWQIEEGVVNLLPAAGEPPLLDVRISEFKIEDAETLDDAANQLMALPSVKNGVADLNLKQGVMRLSGPGYYIPADSGKASLPQRLSVTGNNLTLRQALNAIVLSHGGGVWLYTENHCHGHNEFSVNFPVQ